ncbi:MAG: hypothetical protein HLUCCX21_01600, partial [Porphyrobacter sp. HL-46]
AEAAITKDTSDTRPLAGLKDDEIAQFFTLISASAEIEAELSPLIEMMFEPGKVESGWQDSGIDILAEIGAMEGGLKASLLRDADTEVLSVTDLLGAASPDLTGFTSLKLRAAPPGAVNERTFVSFEPGLWMELASQRTTRGQALCYKGLIGMVLHSEQPPAQWGEDEVAMIGVLVAMTDRIAAREVCLVYDRKGEAFSTRSFLPDGRPLPNVDADSSPLTIMPASALSAFIRERHRAAQE